MWASAISPGLDAALARALADSPRARELARELAGRSVELRLAGTACGLRLRSHGERLELGAPAEAADAADARIVGGALALLALAGPEPDAVLRRGGVRIDGDSEVADRFRELVRLLRPDVEYTLGRAIGPVPAHLATRAARGAFAWGRRAARATLHNASDFLAHESRDLVSAPEAEHVLRGTEQLREQADRLDARLAELDRRVATLRGAGGTVGR